MRGKHSRDASLRASFSHTGSSFYLTEDGGLFYGPPALYKNTDLTYGPVGLEETGFLEPEQIIQRGYPSLQVDSAACKNDNC